MPTMVGVMFTSTTCMNYRNAANSSLGTCLNRRDEHVYLTDDRSGNTCATQNLPGSAWCTRLRGGRPRFRRPLFLA